MGTPLRDHNVANGSDLGQRPDKDRCPGPKRFLFLYRSRGTGRSKAAASKSLSDWPGTIQPRSAMWPLLAELQSECAWNKLHQTRMERAVVSRSVPCTALDRTRLGAGGVSCCCSQLRTRTRRTAYFNEVSSPTARPSCSANLAESFLPHRDVPHVVWSTEGSAETSH